MATLPVLRPIPGSPTLDLDAGLQAIVAGGDVMPNAGNTVLVVKNAGSGAVVVTATPQNKVNGFTVTAITMSVAAGKTAVLETLPGSIFNNSAGQVVLTYSGIAGDIALTTAAGLAVS